MKRRTGEPCDMNTDKKKPKEPTFTVTTFGCDEEPKPDVNKKLEAEFKGRQRL